MRTINDFAGIVVTGTVTDADMPGIHAALADAGIDGVTAHRMRTGTVQFILDKSTVWGNDLTDNPDLMYRVVEALQAAGWEFLYNGVNAPTTTLLGRLPENTEPGPTLWTAQQVADYLAITRDAARRQLSRWGITAATYYPIPGSNLRGSLYDADQVRAAHAARPGRGARTDLRDS
ncbi:hypothetical protein ACFY9A_29135 [Streptomyces rubradiris]|uniref:hypothetical protein n=1 Tax=Streptomyces rubradiris TaxID=285531 RepID=UPI0036EA33D8